LQDSSEWSQAVVDIDQMQEDLRKARRWKIFCLVASVILFALGTALIVMLIVRHELAALFLGAVALIFAALMMNQALRSRDLEDHIESRIRQVGDRLEADGGPSGGGECATEWEPACEATREPPGGGEPK